MVSRAGIPSCLVDPDDSDWLAPATPMPGASVNERARQEAILHLAEVKLEDEKTASRFKEDDYLDRMRLFVRAGHPQALRLCACSFTGDWGGYPQVRQCNISNLCPYCSAIRHDKALLANIAAYHTAGETAFLTLKYHGKSGHGHIADADAINALWRISTDAIRSAIKRGHFTGALISRELAVESLVPLRVMAHIHATIVAPQLNLDELNDALLVATDEAQDSATVFSVMNVVPKVHVMSHRNDGDMLRSIRYSMKTFGCSPNSNKPSLPDLYHTAREHHEPYLVNDAVRELVHIFHRVTHKKHRTSSLGVLSHLAKESLRVPKTKQERRKNIDLVNLAKVKARHSAQSDEFKRLEEGL